MNTPKQVTVNDLFLACKHQVEIGNGGKKIYLSADDEGNGFHPLWYGFNAVPDSVKSYAEAGLIDGVGLDDPCNNIVLLG